ncbi:hypothetical protein BDW59DRAFT_165736 [Aspergillus cavernicola]|uniref:EthD domain-containing protein n=1 Tax=Aspergillus cavernicola TaxID=176166 RepID=A0ABR4HR97_9EURO
MSCTKFSTMCSPSQTQSNKVLTLDVDDKKTYLERLEDTYPMKTMFDKLVEPIVFHIKFGRSKGGPEMMNSCMPISFVVDVPNFIEGNEEEFKFFLEEDLPQFAGCSWKYTKAGEHVNSTRLKWFEDNITNEIQR